MVTPSEILACGLILMFAVVARAWLDGAEGHEGFVRWLMEKPLPMIFAMRTLTILGLVMTVFGLAMCVGPRP